MGTDNAGGPDPSGAADLDEFIGLLGELRVWAGLPSYRVLARRVAQLMTPAHTVPVSTIVDAFKVGRRRLDLDLVVAIVRALGLDEAGVARWRDACVKAHALAKGGGPMGVFGQLPAELATFTGRADILAGLVRQAGEIPAGDHAHTVVISAIEGMAGVGKTQLAIHTAHELVRAGRFADVQLHVNLRGFDPDLPPADPSSVLEAFLRQLAVPAQQIPDSRDERAVMFRDRLRGRDALILLDNAADEDQVRDLIPASPSCLVLITSRRSLAGLDGVSPVPLGVFSEAESVELLMRIAGRARVAAEPAAAARIVRLCGRLPLALALAAARLRSRPSWSLAELADGLDRGRLAGIRAGGRALRPIFDLSYRELSEPVRRFFRLLGHYPGTDFTPAMVAALADTSVDQAEAALELLQDEHLVSQHRPGRYELHDLLRLLAVELAEAEPEPDAGAPLDRLTTWCVASAYAAAVAINTLQLTGVEPGEVVGVMRFDGYGDALAWLDQERHNLAAVQRAAADARLHRSVWQLALVQKLFYTVRHHDDDLLTAQRLAVAAAKASGEAGMEALMLSGLGSAYWRTGRLDEAESCYLETMRVYRSIGDRTGEGSALVDYGAVRAHRGDNVRGVEILTEALDVLHGQDAVRHRGIALLNRGVLLGWLDRLNDGIADSYQALAIFRQLDDRHNEALVLGNIAELHQHGKDFDPAFELYRKQQELGRLLGDAYVQAEALLGIGDTHRATGDTDEARTAWEAALRLLESIDHPMADQARQRLKADDDQPPATAG